MKTNEIIITDSIVQQNPTQLDIRIEETGHSISELIVNIGQISGETDENEYNEIMLEAPSSAEFALFLLNMCSDDLCFLENEKISFTKKMNK